MTTEEDPAIVRRNKAHTHANHSLSFVTSVLTATVTAADGHTVSNAPDLFRPPKLSSTGPG